MNPKPLSSLNHLTVPVATVLPPALMCAANAEIAVSKTTSAGTTASGDVARPDVSSLAATHLDPRLRPQRTVAPVERAALGSSGKSPLSTPAGERVGGSHRIDPRFGRPPRPTGREPLRAIARKHIYLGVRATRQRPHGDRPHLLAVHLSCAQLRRLRQVI